MNDLLLENTNGKVTEVYPIKKKIDVTYYLHHIVNTLHKYKQQ